VIGPWLEFVQARQRVTNGGRVHDDGGIRLPTFDIDTEDLRGVDRPADLETRFRLRARRDDEDEEAVMRSSDRTDEAGSNRGRSERPR
jgi:hypothetical protein